jgi:hypothetical protein
MALGGGTPMSSSTILPDPTSTSGGDSNVMAQRGANYFFGFLITFVILFLIFVGCGIGSRRRLLAERREALSMNAWGTPWSDAEQKKPAFHEYALGVPVQLDQWEYIMVSRICLKHRKLGSTTYFFIFILWSWCPPILRHFLCSPYPQCCGNLHPKSPRTRKLVIREHILPHTLISKLLVVGP